MYIRGEPASAKADLWRAYREAFKEFAEKVDQIELLKMHGNASPEMIDKALLDMEKARLSYNDARDALASLLLSDSHRQLPLDLAPKRPVERAARVREIAELVWELESRREGRAEEDWYRAENIIRSVTTTQALAPECQQGVLC